MRKAGDALQICLLNAGHEMIRVEIRLRPARDGGGAGYGGVEWQRARDVAIGVHGGCDASHDRNVEIEGFVDEAELVDQQALRSGVTRHTSHVTRHTSPACLPRPDPGRRR